MGAAVSHHPSGAGMICLDTNILLRAFLDDDPVQSAAARNLLSSLTRERPGFITFVTLTEMYWVMGMRQQIPKSRCLAVLRRLASIPELEFEDGEGFVQALALAEEGADFPDALIHVTAQQFTAAETVTFDRKAARRLGWRLLDADGSADEGSTARK